jgi:2-oxoglutarate ferredoxin oxidoreductase subunit alpha
MSGMAEIPVVIYLASRPGPSTGAATYTSQGDLNLALHSGHGEFSRIVVAPGDSLECTELTNQCFYFSQKFRIPCILLGDKHLGESKLVFENNPKLIEVQNSITTLERFNSYEHDKSRDNIATDNPEVITKNFEARLRKHEEIKKEALKFSMFKIFGNLNSKNLVISWGSTKGAIIDALNDSKIDAKFMQILFMEPFPSQKVADEIKKAKRVLVVENNATSQLSRLIAEKTGFFVDDKNKILRYDGRPFFSDELGEDVARRLR